MICPKCKKQIPDGSLKCSECGARIAVICKKCSTYNSILSLSCTACGNEFLKICPVCNSINLSNSIECRKCSYKFSEEQKIVEEQAEKPEITEEKTEELEKENVEPLNLNYNAELYSQQKAKDLLIEAILSDKTKIISLNGESGFGKTIVLKSTMHQLKENGFIWLYGSCSSLTQLSPFGFIQDLLLTFFNVSNFCVDGLKLQKESQKFFQSEFPSLTNEEIFNLLNFLYPTSADYFENILQNKDKTFIFLRKVFKTIIENNNVIFVSENFDMIDGLSYEFLNSLINSELIKKPLKFVLTYNNSRPVRGYLYNNNLRDEVYCDISLGKFGKDQMNIFLDQYFPDEKCPNKAKEFIFTASGGNPTILEQYSTLLKDFKNVNNSFDLDFPDTFNSVIRMRLDFLKENQDAYKFLSLAAIQGIKFSPLIINQILNIEEDKFLDILKLLDSLNFIMPVNEIYFAFKNAMLWSAVYECIKTDDEFLTYNTALFNVYSGYTLSSNSMRAVIAQNVDEYPAALKIWTDNIKLAAYIGDTNLYVISQKQCLILSEKIENLDNKNLIKNNIYERLGKLLSPNNPKEAMEYLPNAIQRAKDNEDCLKEIELTGYLADCCISLGNYHGTLECVDSVIEKLDSNMDLEAAMLKSRKTDALLNIGNCGEIINLADNEILPVFDKYINTKPHKNIPVTSFYKAWLQTHLDLANALVLQGNNRCFEVISTLFELFEKNDFQDELFICKTKLSLAFANTVKGDIQASEKILSEIIKVYRTDIMDNEAISRWNLINILNNFITKKYHGLKEELFQVVTFANNINDNFTKNILKTLLGKIFKDEENAKHALEIYSEQITYFSKEKNAIGALLGWYLIADAKLVVEGPQKTIEIAQKALEVAQGPKINNYLFTILYNKVIAEAYIVLSEYDSAKIHIEQAILIAQKFELLTLLAQLYLLYGKYLQDVAIVKKETQVDYVLGASKMYKKAASISQKIKNNYILSNIEKSKKTLDAFCRLNGITLP